MTGSTDEQTNPRLVFVYGTLKDGYPNHRCLYGSPKLGNATLLGSYRMYSLGGFPGVVPSSPEDVTTYIHGELYETTDEVVTRSLDHLEGHNVDNPDRSFFRRTQVMVETDTGPEVCETYFLNQTDKEMQDDGYLEIKSGAW